MNDVRETTAVSEHTKRITDWMRRRAKDGRSRPEGWYSDGWHDALVEIADEIEDNEREGCGHAE